MLTNKAVTQFTTGHDATDKAFSAVTNVLQPVLQTPIVDGTLCENLIIPTNLKVTCNHGLGRPARGYKVTMANASLTNPHVVDSDQKQSNTCLVLTYDSGAGAKISVWVF